MRKKISIIFFAIFILTIISVMILRTENKRLKGDALSGYESNGRYYIMSNSNYIEVTKSEWYKDIIVWVTSLVFFGLSGIGILFFIFAYGFPFVSNFYKQMRNIY